MENLKNKLIIRNYTNLSDLEVLQLVYNVVKLGKISGSEERKQYCYTSIFDTKKGSVMVDVRLTPKGTNVFYIFAYEEVRNEESKDK